MAYLGLLEKNREWRRKVPHLNNVFLQSPTSVSHISEYEYDEEWHLVRIAHRRFDFSHSDAKDYVESLMQSSSSCRTRLVVIEDICSRFVRLLCEYEGIEEEFFEEHLIDTHGWLKKAKPRKGRKFHKGGNDTGAAAKVQFDSESQTWRTRRLNKNYASLKWRRPYITSFPRDLQSAVLSISRQKISMSISSDTQSRNVQSNSWRNHLDFRVHGTDWNYETGSSVNLRDGASIGWQERLSVCRLGLPDGTRLVLVLVDPSFAAQYLEQSQETENGWIGTCWANPIYSMALAYNLRTGFSDEVQDDASPAQDTAASIQATAGSNGAAHDSDDAPENVAVSVSHSLGSQLLVATDSDAIQPILPSPDPDAIQPVLPSPDPDATADSSVADAPDEGVARRGRRNALLPPTPNSFSPSPNPNFWPDPVCDAHPPFRPPALAQDRTAIVNTASRGPAFECNIWEADTLGYLDLITTTRSDFGTWLNFVHSKRAAVSHMLGPIAAVLMIPFYDTLDFLQLVHVYFDDATTSSENAVHLERNILKWRKMINIVSEELRYLERAMPAMFEYFGVPEEPGGLVSRSSDELHLELTKAFETVKMEIEKTAKRLGDDFQSLMSSIAVTESQRSIAEAEGVTRLTELAFIYIPLSFAAGFFGMNVKELDASTTSIYAFVIMAAGVVLLSYGVRLFIRSRISASMLKTVMASVHTYTDTPEGTPIPTATFLSWLGHVSWQPVARLYSSLLVKDSRAMWAIVIGIAAIWLVPLSSVWANKHLADSMKTTMSVAVTLPWLLSLLGYGISAVSHRVSQFAKGQRARTRQELLLQEFFSPVELES